jgi:hypothetical protein
MSDKDGAAFCCEYSCTVYKRARAAEPRRGPETRAPLRAVAQPDAMLLAFFVQSRPPEKHATAQAGGEGSASAAAHAESRNEAALANAQQKMTARQGSNARQPQRVIEIAHEGVGTH